MLSVYVEIICVAISQLFLNLLVVLIYLQCLQYCKQGWYYNLVYTAERFGQKVIHTHINNNTQGALPGLIIMDNSLGLTMYQSAPNANSEQCIFIYKYILKYICIYFNKYIFFMYYLM